MQSLDLSSSTAPRLAVAAQVLASVTAVAEQHAAPLLVIGATARDILSQAVVGSPPGRATADVDVAVAVPSWEAYAALATGFVRVERHPHRFEVAGVPVDLVPFGGLESEAGVLDWSDGARMSTLGLREAYAHSLTAALPGGHEVRMPSIAGLTALKLQAWARSGRGSAPAGRRRRPGPRR